MLYQAFDEVLDLTGEPQVFLGGVVQVAEDHLLAVVVSQAAHRQWRALQIATQVFDVAMVVLAGFGEVDDPRLLVVDIEPAIERRFVGAGSLQIFR